ncbi:MAG: glycosyltransferase family 39 protein [Chloroflexota bacterium]
MTTVHSPTPPRPASKRTAFWLTIFILVIAVVYRLIHLGELSMWWDELWSVFQINGTLVQTLERTPVDWPPLYYVVLHVWTALAGHNDLTVRALSAFAGILTTAVIYRVGQVLHSRQAGWLAALIFAISNTTVYFSIEVRGYALLYLFTAAAIWLYVRWVRKPTFRRAIPYAVAAILALYTHYTAAILIAFTGLYLLLFARRLFVRWLGIVAVMGIALLPQASRLAQIAQIRANVVWVGEINATLLMIPRALSGHQEIAYSLLIGLALVGLILYLRRNLPQTHPEIGALLAGLLFPVIAYLLQGRLGLYSIRYLNAVLPATLLIFGIGLANLPPRLRQISTIALLIMGLAPWQPFDFRPHYSDAKPVRDLVQAMAVKMHPGDTFVIDPKCPCGESMAWWYYEPLYFPGGIPKATQPEQAGRRVWYLVDQRGNDKDTEAWVKRDRLSSEFWGPWYFIATLYEGAPLKEGYLVGDSLRFHGADITPGNPYHSGDAVQMRLWWSADKPLPTDYSFSVRIIDQDGKLLSQVDGPLSGATAPIQTSTWQPGQLYVDTRTLTLPADGRQATYSLQLVAYQPLDQVRLEPVATAPLSPDKSIILDTLEVIAYTPELAH